MTDFMVEMDIAFPVGMTSPEVRALLDTEALAIKPYVEAGEFQRVWRTYGNPFWNHGHLALWSGDIAEDYIRRTYSLFPLVKAGYGTVRSVRELSPNPNDPGAKASYSPLPGELDSVPFTYGWFRSFLNHNGEASEVPGEGLVAEVYSGSPVLEVHDHPHSGKSVQIHVMVGQRGNLVKIAELGPSVPSGEEVAPGYIDILAEWEGKPVAYYAWKDRILMDNGLMNTVKEGSIHRRHSLSAEMFDFEAPPQI